MTFETARVGRHRRPVMVPLLLVTLLTAGLSTAGNAMDERPSAAAADGWPMARGSIEGTGRSAATIRLPLEPRWHRRISEAGFEATPVIADGTIYVGDLDGTLHAIAMADGSDVWKNADAIGYTAAAAVSDTVVVAGDIDGVVRALDRTDGRIRWKHERQGEISGGPTILEANDEWPQRVIVGSQDASLVCLAAASGKLLWSHTIADQIRCSPTVAGDRLFVAGCDGRLHVIDAASGRPTGEVPIDGPTGTTPAAYGGRVFFGSEGGIFWGIGYDPPQVAWKMQPAAGAQAYRSSAAIAMAVTGPLAIVGTRGRILEAFAVADGTRIWRHRMRGRVDGSPVVADLLVESEAEPAQAAFVGDAAGSVVAVEASDGKPRWEFDAGAGFVASPAIADGCLVMAAEDGTLWCFGPPADG